MVKSGQCRDVCGPGDFIGGPALVAGWVVGRVGEAARVRLVKIREGGIVEQQGATAVAAKAAFAIGEVEEFWGALGPAQAAVFKEGPSDIGSAGCALAVFTMAEAGL